MTPFVLFHAIVSVIGIVTGAVVVWGLARSDRMEVLTAVFLASTVITSATGYFLPPFVLDPARIVGTLSLLALALAIIARYGLGMVGVWRAIYAGSAVAALFFNVFVLIAQAFAKLPALHVLAPTGTEPPFGAAEGVNLIVFIAIGYYCVRRFHPRG